MKKLLYVALLILLCAVPAAASAKEPQIEFSLPSGFYEEPQTLEIACNQRKAIIYYTLDGTEPDENSAVYTGAIQLGFSNEREDVLTKIATITQEEQFVPEQDFPTGHVLRAIAISPSGEKSEIISATYLVGYDRQELYGDMAIVFLVTDPAGFFDHEEGIYVLGAVYDEYLAEVEAGNTEAKIAANYTQRGKEWERPVSVTFVPTEGEGFTQQMGVRIKGGASRKRTQKSLRLIAREEYGEKNVKYVLFPDNVREADGGIVDRYKSFTLRNGGNDTNRAKVRDPLISNLATGLRFETAQNMPCIAFLNGEYWGVYTVTEEYTDNYIQYHYGIDNDNVVMFKNGELDEGEETDASLDQEMTRFISKQDMSIAENYATAAEMLDMGSFADYCALHLYIANEDGPFQAWNWQMWRVREAEPDTHEFADGKWRMVLFDVDGGAGLYDDGSIAAVDNITPILNGEYYTGHPARLMVSLLKNEEFKKLLVNSLCDVRNLYFRQERVDAALQEMMEDYHPYVPTGLRRFGPKWRMSDAEQWHIARANELESFFMIRYDAMLPILSDVFSLRDPCSIRIVVNGAGEVYLNQRTLSIESGQEYRYFPEYPLTITAVPAEGATFKGWEVSHDSAVVADPSAKTTEVTFAQAFTLTANFE